jgi:hypothetical protein
VPAFLLAAAMLVPLPCGALGFNYNGFATLTFGDVLSGESQPYLGRSCPCYIANYEYAGVYQDKGWQGNQESLLGLQGRLQLLDPLSATVQVVARASTEKVTVDWAYLTYDLGEHWSLQAGRKRLPLYYYSNSLYIGYSYVWVRTPTDVYGWDIFDYDGANLTYRNHLGDWDLESSLYAGRRSTGNNLMESQLYYGYRVDEAWNKIIGATAELSDRHFAFRLVAQRNKIDFASYDNGDNQPAIIYDRRAPQNIFGMAFTADYANFLWRSEANTFQISFDDYVAVSYLYGAGYKWRDFTGMLTESWYYERRTTGNPEPERQHTHTATLRWDFRQNWDAKIQFDLFQYTGGYPMAGDSRTLTLSVNTVF